MTSIRQKTSTIAGRRPTPADLERGEIAINLADAKLYTKDQRDQIVELGAAPHQATDAAQGIVELATAAETTAGTDATRAVTPAGLKVELDKKAPLASPALTGAPTAPTAAAGTNTTQLATTAFVHAATPDATEAVKGIVELATAAEVSAGTDSTRAITPAGLKTAPSITVNDLHVSGKLHAGLAAIPALYDTFTVKLNATTGKTASAHSRAEAEAGVPFDKLSSALSWLAENALVKTLSIVYETDIAETVECVLPVTTTDFSINGNGHTHTTTGGNDVNGVVAQSDVKIEELTVRAPKIAWHQGSHTLTVASGKTARFASSTNSSFGALRGGFGVAGSVTVDGTVVTNGVDAYVTGTLTVNQSSGAMAAVVAESASFRIVGGTVNTAGAGKKISIRRACTNFEQKGTLSGGAVVEWPSRFKASSGSPHYQGYSIDPATGLIQQWGTIWTAAGGAQAVLTLPLAFPKEVLHWGLSPKHNGVAFKLGGNMSLTAVSVVSENGPYAISYHALGY